MARNRGVVGSYDTVMVVEILMGYVSAQNGLFQRDPGHTPQLTLTSLPLKAAAFGFCLSLLCCDGRVSKARNTQIPYVHFVTKSFKKMWVSFFQKKSFTV